MSKQLTLGTGFDQYAKTTRRARFPGEMDQIVPWTELCELIAPVYPTAGNGRPPRELELMLRIYFLQQWFNLSDPAVEDALYDAAAMVGGTISEITGDKFANGAITSAFAQAFNGNSEFRVRGN